ncbi:MAG: hypothetical protein MR446_07825, partial [Bacteroidales bacterium]|nr:hypothetical protein [Bacteroidales bacterium]
TLIFPRKIPCLENILSTPENKFSRHEKRFSSVDKIFSRVAISSENNLVCATPYVRSTIRLRQTP